MFQSTRSTCIVSDTAAVLQGIAPDGGLFVDVGIASRPFDVKSCMGLGYTEIAKKVFAHLLPEFSEKISSIVSVYPKKFSAAEITPLRAVGDAYALERHSDGYLGRYGKGGAGRFSRCTRHRDYRIFP